MVQKSYVHQLRLVIYPIIHGVLYIPGGCLGVLNHQEDIKVTMMFFFLSKLRDLLQGASTSTRALPHKVHAQLVALPERQDVGNATHSTRNLQNMLLSAIFQYLLLQAVTWQCLWHFLELGPSVRHDQSTYPLPLCNLPEKWWLKQALIPDVIREHLC